MILVTLGTQKESFKRLLDYIENSNINDEIIVQAGHTKYNSKKMKIFDFISYEEMNKYLEKADLIITHAGTGSVLTPLKMGKKVIVCPRYKKYDEHVDNHQTQLVEVLKDEGYVLELTEDDDLGEVVKKAKKFKPKKYKSNTDSFIKKLKKEMDDNSNKKKINFNNFFLISTIILFLTFLIVSYCIPLTGDDWTNANFNTNNIIKIISVAYQKYFQYEGRFMSRVFVLFFTNTKNLWNIFNATMISLFYILSIKIIKPKNKVLISLLFLCSMIFIENTVFTQTYLWVTGNVTYFFPMFLYIVYICLIREVFDDKFKFCKATIILSILLNILIPTMIEHISFSLLVSNLMLMVYSKLKTKKFSKLFIINSIISFIGFLIIYLSPGAKLRAKTMDFYNYTLLEKVKFNLPYFITNTYVINSVLIILISIIILIFINKNIKGYKKYFIDFLILIIPMFNIFHNICLFLLNLTTRFTNLVDCLNKIYSIKFIFIIYWILITLLLLYIIYDHCKKTSNFKSLFFFLIGIIANLAMLLSPISGGKTTLFTNIMLVISCLIILDCNIKENQIFNKLLCFILICYAVLFIILFNSVRLQSENREKMIKDQLISNKKIIEIERFPDWVLWNSNAWNKDHEATFKEYYGIKEEIEIDRKKIKYKYNLIYGGKI